MAVEKAKNVPPFVLWCSATIPTAFDDSMSYYEALCALYKWVQDNIIGVVNNNADILQEYIKMADELKKFVEDYFKNLDVQEEINNKLDEMAEDGELAGIIAQFLEMSPVFAYNTIDDMANADNLSDGCIARVLGNTEAADGDGAYYKVRTKISGESSDGVQKVAIGDTLIADRITNAYYNELKSDIENIEEQLDDYFVLFGDSWADFSQGFENWYTAAHLDNVLGCTLKNFAVGGAGFIGGTSTLASQLTTANTNLSSYEKSHTKYVVVVAGVNDLPATASENLPAGLITEMQSVFNNIRTMFPNAKVIYAPDMCSFAFSANKCLKSMVLANEFFTTHNPYLSGSAICAGYPYFWIGHLPSEVFRGDNLHLNGSGAKAFGNRVLAACLGGNRDPKVWVYRTTFSNSSITVNLQFRADETGNVQYGGYCNIASNPNDAISIDLPPAILDYLRCFYEMNKKSIYVKTLVGANAESFGHCEFITESGTMNFRIPNGATSTTYYF